MCPNSASTMPMRVPRPDTISGRISLSRVVWSRQILLGILTSGSRIDGFVAHLLTFREVEVVDVRALTSTIPGLTFLQADGRTLEGIDDRAVESLSSLHALEHFGLGRYGDELDPEGHRKGMRAAERVLADGGRLWISFPIGNPRVQFNAQRVIDPLEPIELLTDLDLVDFTAIPVSGEPEYSAEPREFRNDDRWCGLYEFMRPATPDRMKPTRQGMRPRRWS